MVNVLFYCDNTTYNYYYGMLLLFRSAGEWINMLPHQYETVCFACHYSILVSLQFWGKNSCTNIKLLVSAQHHSPAVVDWCYLNHSRKIVNRTKTVQQHLKKTSVLILEITCVRFQVGIWTTFPINLLSLNQNKQKHHYILSWTTGQYNTIHPL